MRRLLGKQKGILNGVLKGDFKCGIKRGILNGDYNWGFKTES